MHVNATEIIDSPLRPPLVRIRQVSPNFHFLYCMHVRPSWKWFSSAENFSFERDDNNQNADH